MKALLLVVLFMAPLGESMNQYTLPLHRPVIASGSPCSSLPFSDNFVRPDGPLGSPWTTNTSTTISIVSHDATVGAFSTGDQNGFPSGCPGWTSNHYAQFTLVANGSASNVFGATVNTIDQNNYYFIECTTSGGCNLKTRISGSDSYVSTFGSAIANGAVICFELNTSGTNATLKVNGTYDSFPHAISGLTVGASGGGLYWGSQPASPSATVNNFSTGNGLCP